MIRRRGFTLVELLGTIVILATLGSVASTVLLSATDRYLDSATMVQLNTEVSVALGRIAREIRRVDRDSAAAGIAPDIDLVETSSIYWEGNNSLSVSAGAMELVINGSPARLLLTDVSSLQIAVFDESDLPVPLPASLDACDPIRRVEITIEVTCGSVP